ncbi:MAG: translation elongation factor [Spirochaetes bacterium GWD1_27_9]|nr:MAG: translation elongation factor [Spirochaetes bacterium GWB1_27_13]OHD25770.1 MAG: translation elongation factor [Spirochaetes bacterium GWC1_27_15]OHD30089.1 MAG: translation elongation factor [Spirochaetes bacterium GWD1_27_9]
MNKTKNDISWENLFKKHKILENINKNGFYEIESSLINTEREARLMAKFDHYINLPKIFKDNKLSILPISRNKYIIGNYNLYQKIEYNPKIENIPIDLPNFIETIDYSNLYSESSALHYAFISGMIENIIEEPAYFTVSGRMSTSNFTFNTNDINNNIYEINVNNSQCEIDAGFESKNCFLLIEAKNYKIDDFLIRQLYYPYRLWKNKISKKIIPALMTFSNDVFSFFIYDFENILNYNSLVLKKQLNFIIAPEIIQLSDILLILEQTKIIKEPEVPFPQADKFERIIDLLGLLVEKDLTKDEISENYQFDIRQADYYTNAGIYLNLIDKYTSNESKEILYSLSNKGRQIMRQKHKNKYLSLVKCILEHEIFNKVLTKYIKNGNLPIKKEVIEIMKNSYIFNVGKDSTTIERRSSSVIGWVDWILKLTENFLFFSPKNNLFT